MYATGQGVPQDFTKAKKWLSRVANAGDPSAQYSLGKMYFYGHGVPQDSAETYRWIKKAASAGYAPAQKFLAKHYPGAK